MQLAFPLSLARTGLGAALAAALALSGCGKQANGPASALLPPPEVGVVAARKEQVPRVAELPGRVAPVRVAQVRARVNGVVLKRLFHEGSVVRAGQLLYQIDPAPYEAALQAAQAALAKAEANLLQASAQAQRYRPLAEANAVSKQGYTNVVSAHQQAQAEVAAATAAVRSARINADYASVRAPISGRIGQALVTEGALVSAQEATQLALIQQTDTVYLDVTQSASELQALRRAADQRPQDRALPVTVLLDDDTELPQQGRLLFSDLTVDASTGQVLLRATVGNQDGLLLPGQYVRVRLAQGVVPDAILIPQQGVQRGQRGDTVLVVGPGNKPAPRPVQIGGQHRGHWVVIGGLKEGEQVIVDGFQKLQMMPGTAVTPVPWAAPGGARTAAGSQGGKA